MFHTLDSMYNIVLTFLFLVIPINGAFSEEPASGLHFLAIDIQLPAKEANQLEAFQLEIFQLNSTDSYQLVGVEGGEVFGFEEPPYYDPKAINGQRVILAAIKSDAKGANENQSSSEVSGTQRLVRLHWVGSVPLKSPDEFKIKRAMFLGSSGSVIQAELQIQVIQPNRSAEPASEQ